MKVFSAETNGGDLILSAVKNLAQVFRFDQTEVSVFSEGENLVFQVPSTEWLERFHRTITDDSQTDVSERLTESGYLYRVCAGPRNVAVEVFDLPSGSLRWLQMSRYEAICLYGAALTSVVRPFVQQGGKLEDLGDLDEFGL